MIDESANTKNLWASCSLFVTSTFKDMHAERDYLQDVVFPEIREHLQKKCLHFETIDLRWGVNTFDIEEKERDRKIITVCLKEIDRSFPFQIVLLGDRYGTVLNSDKSDPFNSTYIALQEAGYEGDIKNKSLTALEIEYGAFLRPDETKAFFLFRNIEYDGLLHEAKATYSDYYRATGLVDPDDQSMAMHNWLRLAELKERLKVAFPQRCHEYSLSWDMKMQNGQGGFGLSGLETFGNLVKELIMGEIGHAFGDKRMKIDNWVEEELFEQDAFVHNTIHKFVGREKYITQLVSFANDGVKPELELSLIEKDMSWEEISEIGIWGEPGIGKSSLLAQLFHQLDETSQVLTLFNAAGVSRRSARLEDILLKWCYSLRKVLGQAISPEQYPIGLKLEDLFIELLMKVSQRQRIVLLLDGINQLEDDDRGRHFAWLPAVLPRNVILLVTMPPGEILIDFTKRKNAVAMHLTDLNIEEARNLTLRTCLNYHRELPSDVLIKLLDKTWADGRFAFSNPLWLSIAVDELNLLDQLHYQVEGIENPLANESEQLIFALLNKVKAMPSETGQLYRDIMLRAEKLVGKNFTKVTLGVLAVSRNGLREQDLQAIIPEMTNEKWDPLKYAILRRTFRSHLTPRGKNGQWYFYHQELINTILQFYYMDEAGRRELHLNISKHLSTLSDEDIIWQQEATYHVLATDDPEKLSEHVCRLYNLSENASAHLYDLKCHVDQAKGLDLLIRSISFNGQARSMQLFTCWFYIKDFCHYLIGLQHFWNKDTNRGILKKFAGCILEALGVSNSSYVTTSIAHDCYLTLGDVYYRNREYVDALDYYWKASALATGQKQNKAGDQGLNLQFSHSKQRLMDTYLKLGDLVNAEEQEKELGLIACRLPYDDSEDINRLRAIINVRRGDLSYQKKEYKEAITQYKEALKIRQVLFDKKANDVFTIIDLATTHDRLVQFWMLEEHSQLEGLKTADHLWSALSLAKLCYGLAPTNPRVIINLIAFYQNAGMYLFFFQKSHTRAIECLTECLRLYEKSENTIAEQSQEIDVAFIRKVLAEAQSEKPAKTIKSVIREVSSLIQESNAAVSSSQKMSILQKAHDMIAEVWNTLDKQPDETCIEVGQTFSVTCCTIASFLWSKKENNDAIHWWQKEVQTDSLLRIMYPDNEKVLFNCTLSSSNLSQAYLDSGLTAEGLRWMLAHKTMVEDLNIKFPRQQRYEFRSLMADFDVAAAYYQYSDEEEFHRNIELLLKKSIAYTRSYGSISKKFIDEIIRISVQRKCFDVVKVYLEHLVDTRPFHFRSDDLDSLTPMIVQELLSKLHLKNGEADFGFGLLLDTIECYKKLYLEHGKHVSFGKYIIVLYQEGSAFLVDDKRFAENEILLSHVHRWMDMLVSDNVDIGETLSLYHKTVKKLSAQGYLVLDMDAPKGQSDYVFMANQAITKYRTVNQSITKYRAVLSAEEFNKVYAILNVAQQVLEMGRIVEPENFQIFYLSLETFFRCARLVWNYSDKAYAEKTLANLLQVEEIGYFKGSFKRDQPRVAYFTFKANLIRYEYFLNKRFWDEGTSAMMSCHNMLKWITSIRTGKQELDEAGEDLFFTDEGAEILSWCMTSLGGNSLTPAGENKKNLEPDVLQSLVYNANLLKLIDFRSPKLWKQSMHFYFLMWINCNSAYIPEDQILYLDQAIKIASQGYPVDIYSTQDFDLIKFYGSMCHTSAFKHLELKNITLVRDRGKAAIWALACLEKHNIKLNANELTSKLKLMSVLEELSD